MVMFPPKPKSEKYQVLFLFYGFFLQTSSPFECEERFDWLSDWLAAKTKLTTVHWLGRGEVSGRGRWMMVTGAWSYHWSYRYHYQPTPTPQPRILYSALELWVSHHFNRETPTEQYLRNFLHWHLTLTRNLRFVLFVWWSRSCVQ